MLNIASWNAELCDTVIMYRADLGRDISEIIYKWMQKDLNNYYGRVYYSQSRANANFILDIQDVFYRAKNIVVLKTAEHFTMNFPTNEEEFRHSDTVTTKEVAAIMKRYALAQMGDNRYTRPNIIALFCNDGINSFSIEDKKKFRIIAELVYEEVEKERKGHDELKEIPKDDLCTEMVNLFVTAGINVVELFPESVFNARMDYYLSQIAVHKNTRRIRIWNHSLVSQPPFRIFAQSLMMENEQTDKEENKHKTSESIDFANLIERAKYQDNNRIALIYGDGGMGKTTQMMNYCHTKQAENSSQNTIYLYVPVYRTVEFRNGNYPLYETLARSMGFRPTDYIDEYGENHRADYSSSNVKDYILDTIFGSDHNFVICIDGLDEIKNYRTKENEQLIGIVWDEIKEILEKGCTVAVSSRSKNFFDSSLRNMAEQRGLCFKMKPLENMLEEINAKFRPKPRSHLAKLLSTPFYFSMYYQTVGPNTEGETTDNDGESQTNLQINLKSLYNNNRERFFYHEDPTTAGELIWNYIMRQIAKNRQTDSEATTEEQKTVFYLLYLLPKIAVYLHEKENRKKNVTAAEIESFIKEKYRQYERWTLFWDVQETSVYSRIYFGRDLEENFSLEAFETFCTGVFPILIIEKDKDSVSTNQMQYRFVHSFMQEAFMAIEVINEIRSLRNTDIRAEKYPLLGQKPVDYMVMKRVAEMCGERQGMPVCENGKWSSANSCECNVVRRALEQLRNATDPSAPIIVYNLFSILKAARQNMSLISDLSGVDFSYLNMTKCSLNHIIFSHHRGWRDHQQALTANFRGAIFDPTVSFAEGHTMKESHLKIVAQCEVSSNRMLTADDSGCIVLWDLDYTIPIHVLNLYPKIKKRFVSNMERENRNKYYIAYDADLFTLTIDQDRIVIQGNDELPTRSVKHLSVKNNNKLYYYPTETPMDGRALDGNHEHDRISGEWWWDAVVSKDGKTAYGLIQSETMNPKSCTDIRTFNCVQRRRWDDSEGWVFDKIVLSERDLIHLTRYEKFFNGMLYLNTKEDRLMLCLYGKSEGKEGKKFKGSKVVEIDLNRFEEGNEFHLVYTPLMNDFDIISAACFGMGRRFFASGLSIYRINKELEPRLIHKGVGTLSIAQFLHDTREFYTITLPPACIQFFDSEDFTCKYQYLIDDIGKVTQATLGFQFFEGIKMSKNGGDGYIEYSDRLKIILLKERGDLCEIDISTGEVRTTLSDGTTVVTAPINSYFDERNSFKFSIYRQNLRLRHKNPETNSVQYVPIHQEWLFAGCDFSGVSFGESSPPHDLYYYAKGLRESEELACDHANNVYEEYEEYEEFEDNFHDD